MAAPDRGLPKDVVPPGNQTGKYYIPISNLPFNTTWQGLKDFIKPVSTVDHVQVFSRSTSGWVRVTGYDNFRAVFDHLNGKEFNGRAIIADDRNAERPLKVRDLVVSHPTGSTNRSSTSTQQAPAVSTPESPSYATGGPVSYPDSAGLASPTSTTGSIYGQSSRSFTMSMSPTSYMTSPDTSYSQTAMPSWNALASQPGSMSAYGYSSGPATQSVYGYPAAPDQQPSLYSHSASYAVQPVQPYGDYPTTMSLASQFASLAVDSTRPAGGASSGGIVYTEQRGIHIRDLPRRASEDQVRRLIRDAAGREAELINGIEVPLDKDRNPRGWAFVHFRSADLARRMVGRLDGVEFKGRTLQVRLLKEGEAICSGGNGGGGGGCSVAVAAAASGYRSAKHGGGGSGAGGSGSGSGSRRDQENGGRRREKERGERSSASSKAPPPSSGSSRSVPPLVVGSGTAGEASSSSSSSGKGKGKGKEKEKEKERERERERERHGTSRGSKCSVVIADGSLGRKRSDSDRRTAS